MIRIGQPTIRIRTTPTISAAAVASVIPMVISRCDSQPWATALGGPSRSGVSAPRRKSERSLAKLTTIWMKIAPIRARKKRPASKSPSTAAMPVPASTGATAAGRVGGRTASSQARRLLGAGGAAATIRGSEGTWRSRACASRGRRSCLPWPPRRGSRAASSRRRTSACRRGRRCPRRGLA